MTTKAMCDAQAGVWLADQPACTPTICYVDYFKWYNCADGSFYGWTSVAEIQAAVPANCGGQIILRRGGNCYVLQSNSILILGSQPTPIVHVSSGELECGLCSDCLPVGQYCYYVLQKCDGSGTILARCEAFSQQLVVGGTYYFTDSGATYSGQCFLVVGLTSLTDPGVITPTQFVVQISQCSDCVACGVCPPVVIFEVGAMTIQSPNGCGCFIPTQQFTLFAHFNGSHCVYSGNFQVNGQPVGPCDPDNPPPCAFLFTVSVSGGFQGGFSAGLSYGPGGHSFLYRVDGSIDQIDNCNPCGFGVALNSVSDPNLIPNPPVVTIIC